VEIFSAVRNQAPELPDFPTRELGALKTLGAVVERMTRVLDGERPNETPTGEATDADRLPNAPHEGDVSVPLERRVTESIEDRAPGVATPGLRDARHLAVAEDDAGLAAALADQLSARGLPATVVTGPAAMHPRTDALILIAGPGDALTRAQRALGYARRIAPRFTDQGGTLITVQTTGGDFGASGTTDPGSAGLLALARTAAKEWPLACVRGLDVAPNDDPRTTAARIVAELLTGGDAVETALAADGRRLVLRDVAKPAPTGELMLGPDDVVLATGGGRGVTAAAMIALARESRAGFVLVGRSPLVDETASTLEAQDDPSLKRVLLEEAKAEGEETTPAALGKRADAILASREVRATLQAIEAEGGKALYVVADVTDPEALAEALTQARKKLGPITAIVHGAGVLADKAIADKTDAQIQRVVATKVVGLDRLLEATTDDPLRVVCLFSSVAARFGNAGQSDYAMANEILNKRALALAAERPDLLVRSLGWGPWQGGMVSPALAAHFASQGVELIGLRTGARAFVDELRDGSGEVEVLIGGALPEEDHPRARHRHWDLWLDPREHGYLVDHAIRGQVVLPVALAIELFGRACRASFPHLHLQRLSTLRVLKGVVLDRFTERGAWLRLGVELVSNGDGATVSLDLSTDDERPRYTAMAELGHEPAASHWSNETDRANGNGASGNGQARPTHGPAYGPTYGGVLFHGPQLQIVRSLTDLEPEGAEASLSGHHFSMEGFAVDAGLIDGALQLALLWTEKRLGGASLPTSIGRVEIHRPGPVDGAVRAWLRACEPETGGGRGVCDVHLRGDDGLPIATLHGVETHLLPTAAPSAHATGP
jgi:NADP-dependent 3-hydroxy acid dehydrogenase YdfG